MATIILGSGVTLWSTNIKTLVEEKKYSQAIALAETQCLEEKDANACRDIIKLYKKGLKEFGIERDLSKTLYYAKNACDNGMSSGCKTVGDIYWNAEFSTAAGEKQSLLKAAQYYKKACDNGDKQSCQIGYDRGLIVAVIVLPNIIEPVKQIEDMLSSGYDVHAKLDGMSPLYAAAGKNNIEVAKLLLENGADPMMICDIEGQRLNALDMAKKVEQRTDDKRMLELFKIYRSN